MTPGHTHATAAGRAFLALQALARAEERDMQELLTLYVLEALLARIAVSPARDDVVLKGGVLLAAFDLRRATKDVDLQALAQSNEEAEVRALLQSVIGLDLDDGVRFYPTSVNVERIRDLDDYPGVRVKLLATLGKSRVTIGVDINFGDPIWPQPVAVDVPRLLADSGPAITLRGFPLPMVIAEKVVTAIQRAEANTRWRDFADILRISQAHTLAGTELMGALTAVSDYRQVELVPLRTALEFMPPLAQPKWGAWRGRQDHATQPPEQFSDVLARVVEVSDPPILGSVENLQWDPAVREWGTA